MAVLFALITCITYAIDTYFVRQGLADTPRPLLATVVTLTVNFFFFVALSLVFVPASLFRIELIYPFIIAGVLAPGAARALSYKGIERLGLSINTPIVNAESLFAVIMAILFLNEPMNVSVGAGILSVVSGLVLLGYETGRGRGKTNAGRFQYRYLLFPILASVFYGVSVFFRKLGLNMVTSPILGAHVHLRDVMDHLHNNLPEPGPCEKGVRGQKAEPRLFLPRRSGDLHRLVFPLYGPQSWSRSPSSPRLPPATLL